MIYVVSDVFGCKESFDALLKEIRFSQKDTLYILGNILDKGPEPIGLLTDLSYEPNIVPILGERDYMAYRQLKLSQDREKASDPQSIAAMREWLATGGQTTLQGFLELEEEDRDWVLEYLEEFALYAEIEVKGKKYLLSHAGIAGAQTEEELDALEPGEVLKGIDGGENKSGKWIQVYGNTPTAGSIEKGAGYIRINCDCIHGGKLAAYCLDNGKAYYVDGVETD